MDIKYSADKNEISGYTVKYLSGTDYFWFLHSIIESIEKCYNTEIMNDTTSDYNNFKINDFKLSYLPGNEGNSDTIVLTLEDIVTKETTYLNLINIRSVKENTFSRPGEFYKYYVYSDSGEYRFVISCRSKV